MDIPSPEFLSLFRVVVAPEYAAVDDDVINQFAEEAKLEIRADLFGKRYPRAIALLVAHMMAVGKKATREGAEAGPIKRVKVGDLEREYAVPVQNAPSADSDYEQTRYGIEFLRLRRQLLITPQFYV